MSQSNLRIHPAIGIARVGNSPEYYLGPETMAAEPIEGQTLTGGLPIVPGTESTPIKSTDLRDSDGRLKKQAARFKIYQYQDGDAYTYPSKGSQEVVIGSVVDGKTVKDIVWTAHLANKKANCWEAEAGSGDNTGLNLYKNGAFPPLRNSAFQNNADFNAPIRLQQLVIDAGPRAINGATKGTSSIKFDKSTTACYANAQGTIEAQPNYPVSFPASDGQASDYNASSQPINYLGELQTDEKGRLIVVGGFGLACGFNNQGQPNPNAKLDGAVDNDNWLDDTADGPVTAVLVFEDGSTRALEGSAWVVTTDPAYAPQTLNVVSLWESIYTTWLEDLNLNPNLYNGKYNNQYTPSFQDEVFPIFNAAHMQRWNTNLNQTAIDGHARIAQLPAVPDQRWNVLSYIRKPNDPNGQTNGNLQMPLSLGNNGRSFLTVTTTQYFLLEQWWAGKCAGVPPLQLSAGERLDKTILVNSLGGRFSPGIEATFIVQDANLYNKNWKNPEIGAFRINARAMDYSQVSANTPYLTVGYVPFRTNPVEPGDICKFMAIPWHMDYNSCATHAPDPNPGGPLTNSTVNSGVNTTLFWSWPAQRPVAVYTYDDLKQNGGDLDSVTQRYSVRGHGTQVSNPDPNAPAPPPNASFDGPAMEVGRYQTIRDMLDNWHRIGTIIQGPAIEGYDPSYDPTYFLEVESQFSTDESNLVVPWRNKATDKVYPPQS